MLITVDISQLGLLSWEEVHDLKDINSIPVIVAKKAGKEDYRIIGPREFIMKLSLKDVAHLSRYFKVEVTPSSIVINHKN